MIARTFINDTIGIQETEQFLKTGDHLAKHHGLKFTIAYHKAMRLAVTRGIAGEPLKKGNGATLLKSGLPKGLSPFVRRSLQSRDPRNVRGVLTLLTYGRCFVLPVSPDISPIIDPGSGRIPDPFLSGLRSRSDLKGRMVRKPTGRSIIGSTKSGPAGIALAIALPLLGSIPDKLLEAVKFLGGKRLSIYIEDMRTFYPEDLKEGLSIRKIHHLSDKEGKTRTIGILDGWSQMALKPWHDDIISLLRQQPGDCTFHDLDVVSYLSDAEGSYYSFDLTAATDRFPFRLQKELWAHRGSQEVADSGEEIIIKQEFKSPQGPLRYECGQPMGAYSSGVTFSLCHHLVLQYIKVQVPNIKYVVLGDDIVIKSDEGAKKYKDFIQTLGVSISESKTHVSKDTFEFAKRGYTAGTEVTPFPLNSLVQASTRYVDIVGSLIEASKRGIDGKEVLTQPGLISNYLIQVHGIRTRHSQTIERNCLRLGDFLEWIQSSIPIENLELLWRLTNISKEEGLSEDRTELVLKAVGTAGTEHGEKIDQRIQEALSAYGTSRSDQLLAKKGQYEVPVIRALRDTAQNIHEKMYELVKVLGEAENMALNGKSTDRHIGEILRSISETSIPDPNDAHKRSSALVLRSSATIIRNMSIALQNKTVLEDYSQISQADILFDDYREIPSNHSSIEDLRPYARL